MLVNENQTNSLTSPTCPACDYFEREIQKYIAEENQPLPFTVITPLEEPITNPENGELVKMGYITVKINYCLHCGRELTSNEVN